MDSCNLPGSSRACCMHSQGPRGDERPNMAPDPESQRWIYTVTAADVEKPTRGDQRIHVAERGLGCWSARWGSLRVAAVCSLNSEPRAATCQLCDLGQVITSQSFCFLISEVGLTDTVLLQSTSVVQQITPKVSGLKQQTFHYLSVCGSGILTQFS